MANGPGRLLFGRRTYEHMYGYWPHQEGNPITDVLNIAQKYVASRTLSDPLPCENSVLLQGDAADAVARIKAGGGRDIVVLGSGDLLQSLMARGLVDEYLLMIHPLVLGSGRRMFRDGAHSLTLVDSVITTKGVVMATYQPEER
jgi:dihydrofolate reductase